MPARKGSGELPILFCLRIDRICQLLISVKMVHRGDDCTSHVIASRDKPLAYGLGMVSDSMT